MARFALPRLPRRNLLEDKNKELQEEQRLHEDRMKNRRQQNIEEYGFPVEQEYIRNPRGNTEEISYKNRVTGNWSKDPGWQALSDYQKAAAMSLLEADVNKKTGRPDFVAARNVLGAIVNRAEKEGQALGEHVSRSIYEPIIHPQQYYRLKEITASPEFTGLTKLAEARATGKSPDWMQGATHFITKDPNTMLKLEAADPQLRRSWRGWTGYSDDTKDYANVIMRDSSHAFLAPDGKHSAGQSFVRQPTAAETFTPTNLQDVNPDDKNLQEIVASEKQQKNFQESVGSAMDDFAKAMTQIGRQTPQMQLPAGPPPPGPQPLLAEQAKPRLPEIPRTPPGMPVADFFGQQADEQRRKARLTF